MKNPARDLPRVLNSAMSIVVIGFTLTVTALYIVLPISVVREKDTPIVVCFHYPSISKHKLTFPYVI